LAESCFSSLGRESIGADVNLEGELTPTAQLFSESPSRIIISFDPADADAVRDIAERNNAPFTILGRVGGHRLIINVNGAEAVRADVSDLEAAWRNALSGKLQAEVVSA
jgi:phosphoribosylformylglycinamidine synthase